MSFYLENLLSVLDVFNASDETKHEKVTFMNTVLSLFNKAEVKSVHDEITMRHLSIRVRVDHSIFKLSWCDCHLLKM